MQLGLGTAVEDGDQLLDLPATLNLVTRSRRIGNTMLDVILKHETFNARERRTHRLQLGDDVDAITVVLNHAHEATHLPFDACKARTRVLSSFRRHRLTIPWWGIK
jgi:hypothetical protein